MAKKIAGYLKLQVPAGAANPSPPIGPALGQRGLNIMQFCKDFNAASQDMEKGSPVPVVLTIYADRTFSFLVAMSRTCALVTRPTGPRPGAFDPFWIAAAFFRKKLTGGVFMTKVNDLSW